VDIDAVDQRSGDFGNVTLNLRRRAVALARRISKKSAGLRIISLRRGRRSTFQLSLMNHAPPTREVSRNASYPVIQLKVELLQSLDNV
jgi:hypothetical protein